MKTSPVIRVIVAGLIIFSLFLGITFSVKDIFETVDAFSYSAERIPYTLVIDAGHGGADGGAVSITGTYESSINLSIALKMEQIAAFYGIVPLMTRKSDDISYPDNATSIREKKIADQRSRAILVNSAENPFFISIHQNKYTSSGPKGAQTFYNTAAVSKDFAECVQNLLIKQIDPSNNRTASKISSNIYLMKNIACPAVLIECGFISNKNEALMLENSDYQLKLATIITGGYIGYSH